MELEEAKAIYAKPKGHSREELIECLRILNSQPLDRSYLQALALRDASDRLLCLELELRGETDGRQP